MIGFLLKMRKWEIFVSNLNASFIPFNGLDIKHLVFNKYIASGSACVRDVVLTVVEGTIILGSALTTVTRDWRSEVS